MNNSLKKINFRRSNRNHLLLAGDGPDAICLRILGLLACIFCPSGLGLLSFGSVRPGFIVLAIEHRLAYKSELIDVLPFHF